MREQELSCKQAAVLFDLQEGAGVVSGWERHYGVYGHYGHYGHYDEGGLEALEPSFEVAPRRRPPPDTKDAKDPGAKRLAAKELPELEGLRRENDYLRAQVWKASSEHSNPSSSIAMNSTASSALKMARTGTFITTTTNTSSPS